MASGKKNKKNQIDMYGSNAPANFVRKIYLVCMIFVFPLIMTDKYFNITITRTRTFEFMALGLLIFIIAAGIIEYCLGDYYDAELVPVLSKAEKIYAKPELYAVLFLIANLFAFIMAEDKQAAFTGEKGRFFGVLFVLCLVVTFVILARRFPLSDGWVVPIFISSLISNVIVIMQHFGADPFHLREKISKKQSGLFVSTFGNINTYGSYLCVIIALYAGIFIFATKLWVKVVAGIGMFIGAFCIITAKSDDVYIGIVMMLILLFYISVVYKKLDQYMISLVIITVGVTFMSLINVKYSGSTERLNGLAEIIQQPKTIGLLTALVCVITVLLIVFKKTKNDLFEKLQSWKLLSVITLIGIVATVVFVIYGMKAGVSFLTFDYKWGTYRGYVWTKGAELFKEADIQQKIFGYGNESIASLMRDNFYNEMLTVTGKSYDNLHNEVLQYLITTGLFGMLSYIGIFVSGVIYLVKNAKGSAIAISCAAACTAYFFQGLVNLNQPITTPFYFVIMAIGVGYIRYRDKV